MRGKITNLCLGFLNVLFGILIAIFTIKVPQDKILLTVQETVVVNYILKGIYVSMFLIAFIDIVQSFNHRTDTTFNIGYILGSFVISFWFIKQPFIAIFSIISGMIILYKSVKENLIELDSMVAISISILLMAATAILMFFSFRYAAFGQRIKNKENKDEQKYVQDYFRYITELDIHDYYINVKKDGKFGYINPNGDIVINFEYDYASPFVKINAYGKEFYIALMCKDGSSYIKLKNERTVMSYRTESADDNYGAKMAELEDIYTNTLKQTEPMQIEMERVVFGKNRVPIYNLDQEENVKTYNYNTEYDLVVTQSSMGTNDIYELVKKNNPSIKITLDTTNLDYDDQYLYLFANGYIPFYEISKSTQGWFTNYGKKNDVTGRAQILEYFNDERILLKDFKDNSIYFTTPTGKKLSDNYYDIYVCGDGRYIVKDNDNYYRVIDNEYNSVFDKKYAAINTRFISQGLYLVLNSTDDIQFNDYGYAVLNWTLLNYNGEEIATNLEYIYDMDYKIDKVKNIDEENYLLFVTNLKSLNCEFVGDKFYTKYTKK